MSNSPLTPSSNINSIRYAAYLRVSSPQRVYNWSLDAQQLEIQEWINCRDDGDLKYIYIEAGFSGKNLKRRALSDLLVDASQAKFDALVVHRWDRLGRNRNELAVLKTILREQFNLKVFCVLEDSIDDPNIDPQEAADEELYADTIAEIISLNSKVEISKSHRTKHHFGRHLRAAPFGYDLGPHGVLFINPEEAEVVRLIFKLYLAPHASVASVAQEINRRGYRTKQKKAFTKDFIVEILKNRVYIGEVMHQPYQQKPDGSRNMLVEVQWEKGAHQSIIDLKLWEQVQSAKAGRTLRGKRIGEPRFYLLKGLVRCEKCLTNKRDVNTIKSYGHIHCGTNSESGVPYYRCDNRRIGLGPCGQKAVPTAMIDQQVIETMMNLSVPREWREPLITALSRQLTEEKIHALIESLKTTMTYDHQPKVTTPLKTLDRYRQECGRLKFELEQRAAKGIDLNAAREAHDRLIYFGRYWNQYHDQPEQRQKLIHQLISEVWVRDQLVTRIVFKLTCHTVYHLYEQIGLFGWAKKLLYQGEVLTFAE